MAETGQTDTAGRNSAVQSPQVQSPQGADPVRLAAFAVLLISFATIAGAWMFEFAGYAPCPLCLEQRIPYYVGVPLALITFLVARAMPGSGLGRVLVGILGVLFVGSAVYAAYHAGVEWKFWPGPTDCGAGAGAGAGGQVSAGNLLQTLEEATLIRCDEPALRIAGLSLAGWNVIISAAMAGISLRAAAKR